MKTRGEGDFMRFLPYHRHVLAISLGFLWEILPAWAALPTSVTVAIPSGGTINFALPPEMCAYPPQIRQSLANFLAQGTPQLHLLGAAGDCYAINQYLHGDATMISPTTIIAMFQDQINRRQRMSTEDYHKYCLTQYPSKFSSILSGDIRTSINRVDKLLSVNGEVSLGVLAYNENTVFGGLAMVLSNDARSVTSIQVVACFSPGGVPVLWTFAGNIDRTASPALFETYLNAALQLAEDRVSATLRLNN